MPDISSAQGSASDFIRLVDSIPEIDSESTEGKVPQNVRGHIRIEDVHFRYPTRPGVRVLRDLNLTVELGTYVTLVSASGCGKSTTIQLIERFYDPLAGKVLVRFLPFLSPYPIFANLFIHSARRATRDQVQRQRVPQTDRSGVSGTRTYTQLSILVGF